MTDQLRGGAARTATLVAVPVALVIGALSLWRFGAFDGPPAPPAPVTQPTAPVTMAAPALPEDVAAVCRSVVANLPDAVREFTRRPVTAGAEQNAAYGEPPITVACGVATPTFAPTDELYPLSGVCFVSATTDGGTVWTTVDRTVAVAVRVPGPAEGSAQSVIPFSAAIGANDPPLATPPANCS